MHKNPTSDLSRGFGIVGLFISIVVLGLITGVGYLTFEHTNRASETISVNKESATTTTCCNKVIETNVSTTSPNLTEETKTFDDVWVFHAVQQQVSNFQLVEQSNGSYIVLYKTDQGPNMSVCVKEQCPVPGKTILNISDDLNSMLVTTDRLFLFGANIYALDLKTGAQDWKSQEEHYMAKFDENATNLILTEPYKIAALGKDSGVKKWEYKSGSLQTPGDFLRSSIINNGLIYVSGDSGTIYVLDEGSGKVLKSYPLGTNASFSRFFGALDNGLLCLENSKKVSLFNTHSGQLEEIFSVKDQKYSISGLQCSGNSIYFVETVQWEDQKGQPSKIHKNMYKISSDGKIVWTSPFYQSESDELPKLNTDNTKIFFSRYNSASKGYEIIASLNKPENTLWTYNMGMSRVHVLAESNGVLYILGDKYIDECAGQCFQGELKALDSKGGKLLWSFPINEQIVANVWALEQGIFYYTTYNGSYVHALRIN